MLEVSVVRVLEIMALFSHTCISPPQLFCIFGGVDKGNIIFASSFLL